MSSGSDEFAAIRAFIEWGLERGLDIEQVSYNGYTVKLRGIAMEMPWPGERIKHDGDEDIERDDHGHRIAGPPRDVYAHFAREFRVKGE